MYLKLGTRQTKTSHIIQTNNYTEHILKALHKTGNILDLGIADRGASGSGEGGGRGRIQGLGEMINI